MAIVIPYEEIQKQKSFQATMPSVGLKYGVAKPLYAPYSLGLTKGTEYKIAFAMRTDRWTGDKNAIPRYKEKQDIFYMWLALDNGAYTYWGSFRRFANKLIRSSFEAAWELTEVQRMVLIEKVSAGNLIIDKL